MEVAYWRSCSEVTLLGRIRNQDIKQSMAVNTLITGMIQTKQLWYGVCEIAKNA